jgi:hypothetical protein
MAMATELVYKVELKLAPVGGCDREQLEALAVDVMEAIDEFTSDAVLGSAASATFDPPTLELDILIRAASLSGLHRQMSNVMEALEQHAGIESESGSSYVESARPDEDLVPA